MEGRKEGGEEGGGRGRGGEEGRAGKRRKGRRWMGSAEKWRRGGRGRGGEMQREEGRVVIFHHINKGDESFWGHFKILCVDLEVELITNLGAGPQMQGRGCP